MNNNFDVFISHSSQDSNLAYAICHYLEEREIRCWIAPRDVQGGVEYAEAIINGIRSSKVMVVLFNENANKSLYVKNEVERAFNYKNIIIPFKIDDAIPSATLELFLSSVHWLDAVKGNAENYFELLYENCVRSLGRSIITLHQNTTFKKTNKLEPEAETIISKKRLLFYYELNGKPEGPFELNDLKNKITKETFVWKQGMETWLPAEKVTELTEILSNCPQPFQVNISIPPPIIKVVPAEIIPSVKIGNQEWMTKNLDVTHFRNGDEIPEAKSIEDWFIAGKNREPRFCYYNCDLINGVKYGKLYNWFSVNDKRELAPEGYKIPDVNDFEELIETLGGYKEAGNKVRLTKRNDFNESGFSAMPGGHLTGRWTKTEWGDFSRIGIDCAWFTNSVFENNMILSFSLEVCKHGYAFKINHSRKIDGFSVRCLKMNQ